jgi:CRISPR/Cas system Type II protein with McrA/HNH and RuvC-like nuclease domain
MRVNRNSSLSQTDFLTGLIFGFDVGTGSIGYAVRKGNKFKDVGVLICDSEGSDLSKRRDLRRQRRTLRSKKYRRLWFANELTKLGLPKPGNPPNDPITLRVRALNGETLKPEELHAALTNLFKRRGYSKVPWANIEKAAKESARPTKDEDDEGVKEKVEVIRARLGSKHPCQFLAEEKARVGNSPTDKWARKIYWPREVLQKEFEAIAEAQKNNFPALADKSGWLLYGDSQSKKKGEETFHVFFKTTEARNPGVMGLRWPRFDNRGPALDSLQPVDEQGRPLHVIRKNKEAFTKAQWELALMNLRVTHHFSITILPKSITA